VEYSGIRYIDELHVRLRGGKGYVYVVEDDPRNVIALELTERRDGEATARALRKTEAGSHRTSSSPTGPWPTRRP
jgi:transposase-like protein